MKQTLTRFLVIAICAFAALVSSGPWLAARALVLPVEAIDDAARLSAGEFSRRYPGIDVTGYFPDEEGFYINYNHQDLDYYFGPLDDYNEAIRWKDRLMVVREEVVSLRPSLGSSDVTIYEFTYDMFDKNDRCTRRKQPSYIHSRYLGQHAGTQYPTNLALRYRQDHRDSRGVPHC